ncbi:MAG: hypothetical protein RLZZ480_537, partial [Candidatus Parcubacteria bacterium]
ASGAPVTATGYTFTVTGDLSGNGTMTGTTTLSGADIQTVSGSSVGNITIGGGTKQVAANTTIGGLAITATTTIRSDDDTLTLDGALYTGNNITLIPPVSLNVAGNVLQNGLISPMTEWTDAATTGTWSDVVYGEGVYVTVNSSASGFDAMYSTDGITWTGVNASAGAYWSDVTYGNGRFVAVGQDSTYDAMYSDNGTTWTAVTVSSASVWTAVTYDVANAKYVAVGSDATYEAMTSSNGSTWTIDSSGPTNAAGWTDLVYGNGRVVAVANGGATESAYTTDANTWTNQASGPAGTWTSVTYDDYNGYFVAVESGGDTMYATDGHTWTSPTIMPGAGAWQSVVFHDGLYLTVANSGTHRMAYSTNRTTWRPVSVDTSVAWTGVAGGDGRYVLVSPTYTAYADKTTVTLNGTSQQTLAGTLDGKGAFNNLTITNSSESGSSTQSVLFGAPLQVLGTYTMEAGSSARFQAGATSTLGHINLQGATDEEVYLRSSSQGSYWYLAVPGEQLNVEYVNVSDSRAGTTVTAAASTNAGHNVNWVFTEQGSSTIAAHDAGQVSNAFAASSDTNETLFAFKLSPNSGSATTTDIVFTLTGVKKLTGSEFSSIRLFKDNDNDRVYDVTDQQVGGTGVLSISGDEGTITFAGDFAATTSRNYILVANWTTPPNGSFMNIDLPGSGITIVDSVSRLFLYGDIAQVQHSRNNKGGGGGASSDIGGAPPEGDGDVGGGESDGGEEIGSDPNFFRPSAESGSWGNAAFAYDATDGTYATTASANTHNYTNHSFSVPGANTITGIEVKLEVSGTTAAGTIGVELSWDGGTSWTSMKTTSTLTTSDAVVSLGGASDTWGRSWSATQFSNANFAVRLTGAPSSNTIRVDEIQVRVYHQASGGGGGGGADI